MEGIFSWFFYDYAGTGSGVYSTELNLPYSLHSVEYVSVYQTELVGLLNALDHLLESRMHGKSVGYKMYAVNERVLQNKHHLFET